jgi:hypothetical protein
MEQQQQQQQQPSIEMTVNPIFQQQSNADREPEPRVYSMRYRQDSTYSDEGSYGDPGTASAVSSLTRGSSNPHNAKIRYLLVIAASVSLIFLVYIIHQDATWYAMLGTLILLNLGILAFYASYLPVLLRASASLVTRSYAAGYHLNVGVNIVSLALLTISAVSSSTLSDIMVPTAIGILLLQGLAYLRKRFRIA